MEPLDKSKTIKHEFVIDDGRIESLQVFLSPEQLYNDLIVRVGFLDIYSANRNSMTVQ